MSRSSDWPNHDALIRGGDGLPGNPPRACLANVITALTGAPEWQGVLRFDEFTATVMLCRAPPWAPAGSWRPRAWGDADDIKAAEWMQRHGIMVASQTVAEAVHAVSAENPFHPVRDYLDGLPWDRQLRLDGWLSKYCGAARTDYVAAVGARFLIGAVARIFQPGCKMDCALVLEGPQGVGKSSTLRALAEPWFSDEIADFGSKEAAEQTSGVWLIELAEMGSLSKPEVAKIKAFMSRSADRFRPAYGRRVREFPRQCVFAGTVNGDEYLRDETGGRRFWPIRCGAIRTGDVIRDRDQLWAEAVHRYRQGASWWLDMPSLRAAAQDQQDHRYEQDPWRETIASYVEGRAETSRDEILWHALKMPAERANHQHAKRIAAVLGQLGWVRKQVRRSGRQVWVYVPGKGTGDRLPLDR